MATPTYLGSGQPPLENGGGWLGRLGSIFGADTPSYAGDGQPASKLGALGRVTPAYAPATTAEQPDDAASQEVTGPADLAELTTALAAGQIVIAVPRTECPIDPAALAAGQIAIVVPRIACAPDRDEA